MRRRKSSGVAGSTSDRRQDRPLVQLPVAVSCASSRVSPTSPVQRRGWTSLALSAAAPQSTTCTPWEAAMEATPLAACSPLASQYVRQHLIHLAYVEDDGKTSCSPEEILQHHARSNISIILSNTESLIIFEATSPSKVDLGCRD
ncbi:uncharacterized protein LOC119342501 [Triticum dicoccoides]|uniref:uncharacterized protein LOC119342501 n=1 Tax=Triticum dicoccoides TaxID=85692 RepID=UPI00188F217E|nr:uncharacterized protein LOC119342501 [Triticum dicoccoides]